MNKNQTERRGFKNFRPTPSLLAPVLGVACIVGCGEGEPTVSTETVTVVRPPSSQTEQSSNTRSDPRNIGSLTIKFWDREGGSPHIKVYPGPRNTRADKQQYERYFETGDVVGVECVVTHGRTVTADPNAVNPSTGQLDPENPGHSEKWYKLDTDLPTFATELYTVPNPQVLKQLEECS